MHSFKNFLLDISLEKLVSNWEPGYNSVPVENSKSIVKENFAFFKKLYDSVMQLIKCDLQSAIALVSKMNLWFFPCWSLVLLRIKKK